MTAGYAVYPMASALLRISWISFYLKEPGDIERAIALLQQSFELAAKQWSRKRAGEKESA